MSKQMKTLTFTVTAPEDVLERLSRLLWMMDYAAAIGHSGYFGMPLDGDGADRFHVKELAGEHPAYHDTLKAQYKAADMSGGLELAFDGSFGSRKLVPR